MVLALDCYLLGRRGAAPPGWDQRHSRSVSLGAIAADSGTAGAGTPVVISVISVWGFFIGLPYAAGRAIKTEPE